MRFKHIQKTQFLIKSFSQHIPRKIFQSVFLSVLILASSFSSSLNEPIVDCLELVDLISRDDLSVPEGSCPTTDKIGEATCPQFLINQLQEDSDWSLTLQAGRIAAASGIQSLKGLWSDQSEKPGGAATDWSVNSIDKACSHKTLRPPLLAQDIETNSQFRTPQQFETYLKNQAPFSDLQVADINSCLNEELPRDKRKILTTEYYDKLHRIETKQNESMLGIAQINHLLNEKPLTPTKDGIDCSTFKSKTSKQQCTELTACSQKTSNSLQETAQLTFNSLKRIQEIDEDIQTTREEDPSNIQKIEDLENGKKAVKTRIPWILGDEFKDQYDPEKHTTAKDLIPFIQAQLTKTRNKLREKALDQKKAQECITLNQHCDDIDLNSILGTSNTKISGKAADTKKKTTQMYLDDVFCRDRLRGYQDEAQTILTEAGLDILTVATLGLGTPLILGGRLAMQAGGALTKAQKLKNIGKLAALDLGFSAPYLHSGYNKCLEDLNQLETTKGASNNNICQGLETATKHTSDLTSCVVTSIVASLPLTTPLVMAPVGKVLGSIKNSAARRAAGRQADSAATTPKPEVAPPKATDSTPPVAETAPAARRTADVPGTPPAARTPAQNGALGQATKRINELKELVSQATPEQIATKIKSALRSLKNSGFTEKEALNEMEKSLKKKNLPFVRSGNELKLIDGPGAGSYAYRDGGIIFTPASKALKIAQNNAFSRISKLYKDVFQNPVITPAKIIDQIQDSLNFSLSNFKKAGISQKEALDRLEFLLTKQGIPVTRSSDDILEFLYKNGTYVYKDGKVIFKPFPSSPTPEVTVRPPKTAPDQALKEGLEEGLEGAGNAPKARPDSSTGRPPRTRREGLEGLEGPGGPGAGDGINKSPTTPRPPGAEAPRPPSRPEPPAASPNPARNSKLDDLQKAVAANDPAKIQALLRGIVKDSGDDLSIALSSLKEMGFNITTGRGGVIRLSKGGKNYAFRKNSDGSVELLRQGNFASNLRDRILNSSAGRVLSRGSAARPSISSSSRSSAGSGSGSTSRAAGAGGRSAANNRPSSNPIARNSIVAGVGARALAKDEDVREALDQMARSLEESNSASSDSSAADPPAAGPSNPDSVSPPAGGTTPTPDAESPSSAEPSSPPANNAEAESETEPEAESEADAETDAETASEDTSYEINSIADCRLAFYKNTPLTSANQNLCSMYQRVQGLDDEIARTRMFNQQLQQELLKLTMDGSIGPQFFKDQAWSEFFNTMNLSGSGPAQKIGLLTNLARLQSQLRGISINEANQQRYQMLQQQMKTFFQTFSGNTEPTAEDASPLNQTILDIINGINNKP